MVNERLGRSPRFRQAPYLPDGASGLPAWADDQDFDLDYHVVKADTDGPVNRQELDELLAEWMTTPIDETKPLWRVQYIGPTEDGAALMVKSSHALADGLGSIALFAMLLFDVTVEPQREEAAPWSPAPLPTASELKNDPSGDAADADSLLDRATSLITHPQQLREAANATAGVGSYLLRKSREEMPASPLANGTGAPLELRTLEYPLDRLKLLGRGLGTGATMNDVILGLVAGGLRQWLIENGEPLEDLAVRVPVSLKKDRKAGEAGNPGVAPMVVPLPVEIDDPVRRVRNVRERTESIKAAGEPAHNLAVRKMLREAPSQVRDRILPLITGRGQANVAIHNLPGPPIKLYVLGAPTASLHSFTLPRVGLALHLNVVSVGGVVSMSERTVKSGESLAEQGQHGDLFFLIVEGKFDVSADGKTLRELGPGESFGEIALLRDTERTATVTASSKGVVMVLSRDAFLEAVAADPTSMVVAEAIINTRLGDLGRYQIFGDGES